MPDVKYTRVTDVLYPFSGLQKVNPEILKNAADRGTKVHEACTAIINEMGVIELNPNFTGFIESFRLWISEKDREIITPNRWYCDEHMLTGECDFLYKEGKGYVLVDLKTPAKESRTWSLQGSAYAYLAKKEGFNIKRIEFLKLSRDGKKPTKYEYEYDFDTFMKCLDLYRIFFKDLDKESILEHL